MPFGTARRFVLPLLLVCTAALAACGGGGGSLPSTSAPSPKPAQIISQNGDSITLTGTVVAMISGGFQVQGGPGVGYLHIYTNSNTVITGPAPFVNENVEVVGTGSLHTGNITATSVSQMTSSPSPGASIAPTATPVSSAQPSAAPQGTPIPQPSGIVEQTGQITSVNSTRMTVQAGRGCGSIYVYLNSSTNYFDGSPATGQYGTFTGTGNRCGSITSASVSLASSAFTSSTTTGTVAQAEPYGFLLNTGSTSVPVAIYSSTVIFGGTLMTGSQVTVTALGTTSTGLTATQIAVAPPPTPTPNPSASPSPTPGPITMQHVAVAGFIYGYGGIPTSIPLSEVTPYVNWAFTDEQHAQAIRAAGLKLAIYTNFWRNYSSDSPSDGYTDLEPGGPHADTEALDCNNNPLYDPNYGGGYEADARDSAALTHAQIVSQYREGEYGNVYDALFSDDTGSVGGMTPCNYNESTYDQATNAVHTALGVPMWVNALGGAPNPANAIDLAQPANVLGAECEQCYSYNGTQDGIQTGTSWTNVENAEIGMVAQHKVFWDYARATGDASQETGLRLYAYASFLLSFDPTYTMLEEALATPIKFPVMPETGFVPMQPLTTASSVSGYQAPGGAYFREYAACYFRGQFVSNCAVVVNPGSSNVPVPSTSYSHSAVLSGYGVLDTPAGTMSFNGGAVSSLAPGTAAILFP